MTDTHLRWINNTTIHTRLDCRARSRWHLRKICVGVCIYIHMQAQRYTWASDSRLYRDTATRKHRAARVYFSQENTITSSRIESLRTELCVFCALRFLRLLALRRDCGHLTTPFHVYESRRIAAPRDALCHCILHWGKNDSVRREIVYDCALLCTALSPYLI